jgi:hypothetical protein
VNDAENFCLFNFKIIGICSKRIAHNHDRRKFSANVEMKDEKVLE